MNTYIFLYPETSFFEVDLAAYFMKTKGDVFIISEDGQSVMTNEGIKIEANMNIESVNVEKMDVLIICGGYLENIKHVEKMYALIKECKKNDVIIGGICAGRELVTTALDMGEYPDKTCLYDKKIVLSPGNEYVDFALKIGEVAKIYSDEEDYLETVRYFKEFRNI